MSPAQDPPRPPLTDEERLWLTDHSAFAEAASRGPLVLSDRTIEELEITDQAFVAVTWDSVDFVHSQFLRTTIVDSQFRDVTFVNCRFEDVAWARCRFDRCELESAELERVRLVDCTADRLALVRCECAHTELTNDEFRAFSDELGNYSQAQWTNLRLVEPSLTGSRFLEARVEDLTIVGGTLADVTFSDSQGRALLLQGTFVDGLDFVFGTWVALTCDGVTGRSLRLTDVHTTGLSVLGSDGFTGVAIAGGSVIGLAVDRSPLLGLFSLAKVDIHGLVVSRSFIDGAAWHDCTIGDDSSISETTLAGLNLGGSRLDGVGIRDTEFTVWLGLENARIQGLVLERIRYAAGLDLRTNGVDYGPGAKFPIP
jgi:uncharacterized protein YjbI with pentapeptide repeats